MSEDINIDVQRACSATTLPSDEEFCHWAEHVLHKLNSVGELTIRLVDESEMQTLNRDFRQQDKLTNVLSFGVEQELREQHGLLGDIIICAAVVEREAEEQNKTSTAHWAHLVMHGVLHLLGFDHVENDQAEQMEAYEIEFLSGFGFANPYQLTTNTSQGRS